MGKKFVGIRRCMGYNRDMRENDDVELSKRSSKLISTTFKVNMSSACLCKIVVWMVARVLE